MLLQDRTAVIYGGSGSIGGAVARALAAEGAHVALAARTQATLDAAADDIRAAGGSAETALVDAYDEAQVDAFADDVAERHGGIDVSFCAVSQRSVHGTPMHEMALEDFRDEIVEMVTTQFLTMRAAARHMVRGDGGTILLFGGDGEPLRDYHIGGTQVAFTAVEQMRRQLAVEAGRQGVRVVSLRTGGIPASIPGDGEQAQAFRDSFAAATTLGRPATLEDVGRVAAFVASDHARSMTGATVNVSCGALLD
jgi:3-oxoacyl-[acyl-carrier protein] reductase